MAQIEVGGFSDSKLIKWREVEPDTELRGVWRGARDGKFGLLGDLETTDGERITVPIATTLEHRLNKIKVGAAITIKYLGVKHNEKSGRDFHDFKVYADDADLMTLKPAVRRPAASSPSEISTVETADDEAPF